MEDADFTKGFNTGYNLQSLFPELTQKLLSGIRGNSAQLEGMLEGAKQIEIEKYDERLKDFSRERIERSKQKDRGR